MIVRQTSKIDVWLLATCLGLSASDVAQSFRDGRVASRWCELWACRDFGLRKQPNSNCARGDAFVATGADELLYEVRCLTHCGVSFQPSKSLGSGRTSTLDSLKGKVRSVDRWAVYDITEFPSVTVYRLKSSMVEGWIDLEQVKPSGRLSYQLFNELVDEEISEELFQTA